MSTGYGQDMSCTSALVTGRQVTGRRLLAEAIYRRLTTPRGTLTGDDEASAYGLDLSGYVGAVEDAISASALPALIESELLKDDRIASIAATVERLAAGAFQIAIEVTPASDLDDFALTLGVDAVDVTVIGGLS